MTLLPGARDLLLLVVCFELMGLPLYVLAAFAKTDSATTGSGGAGRVRGAAAEAGLKLYLVGAGSTALMLFGLSLVTGLAGGTGLSLLGAAPHGPLLVLGMILLLAGMSFKLGVAPFHMWVPDTYQGAGTPFVAVLSAAPKAAGVAAVALIFIGGLPAQQAIWAPLLVALCVVTLSVGTLLALSQTNIKRLLAYSGVAHAGFMLMALATGTELGLQMLLFYLLSYVLTNVGSFLVVHAVAVSDGSDDSAQSFDGLAQRSPWLACAWLLFLLSLAGIPFVSGFWAKTYVFIAAYRAGMLWLVALGALLSVLALFYYLQLAKAAYVSDPTTTRPVRVSVSLRAAIVFCLVGVVGIGVWPAPFLEAARRAAVPFFDAKALALAEAERASTAPRVHPRHVFVSETTLILARPAAARTEITSEGALDEEP
jgi:NADH-quinone oxidoreductase subunit N